ncbi:MAG: Holliday junction resolvase RuvX, partial [Dehalococcoidia bacterium]|nr:Holliday junction resolvase RuvX [Dehalococcoidia bacterium]
MAETRSLGLDIGDRWIGVAMSDPQGILASPLTIIRRTDESSGI